MNVSNGYLVEQILASTIQTNNIDLFMQDWSNPKTLSILAPEAGCIQPVSILRHREVLCLAYFPAGQR